MPQIRSYAKAFDAAVDGLAVWTKQQARDAKKTAAPPPPPVATAKAQPAPSAKPETPATRKAKDHQKLEASLA